MISQPSIKEIFERQVALSKVTKESKVDDIFQNKDLKRISHYKKRRNQFLNNTRLKRECLKKLKPSQVKCEFNYFSKSIVYHLLMEQIKQIPLIIG